MGAFIAETRRRGEGAEKKILEFSAIPLRLRVSAVKGAYGRITVRLPDCKPVSVPFRVAVILLGRTLLCGSSNLPGSRAGRAAPPPLFGLAPRGACPASGITPAAVRSYRTISPLPSVSGRRYIFCGAFRRTLRPSRPLAGTLPCGDRTFLSRFRKRLPVRQPHPTIVAFSGAIRPVNTPAVAPLDFRGIIPRRRLPNL
jgi:hypothetical protein